MHTSGGQVKRQSRIGVYLKVIAVISTWGILTIALYLLLKATWSPVVMARGSDMLVSLYRVSTVPASIAYIFFSASTLAFALSHLLPIIRKRRQIRPIALGATLLSSTFMLLALHAITISSKHEKPELNEFIGPFLVRSFEAPNHESPIPAYCEGSVIRVVSSEDLEARIFLGFGFWSISQDICLDTRLSSKR